MKLPVCPHCHTVYRYGEVRRLLLHREAVCYHCQKRFQIKKTRCLLLLLIWVAVCVAVNILSLVLIGNITVIGMFITNVILAVLAILLTPFFIRFTANEQR